MKIGSIRFESNIKSVWFWKKNVYCVKMGVDDINLKVF